MTGFRRPFLSSIASISLLLGFGAGYFLFARPYRSPEIRKIRAALEVVKRRYYGDVPYEKVVDGALEGMTARLDPYCEYFTPREWKEFNDVQLKGRFGGIGVVVESDRETGFLNIVTPVEDSPAFEADLLPGDQIREVDGKSIKGQTQQEIVQKIKGEPGTKVTLKIHRKGKDPFTVTLVRAEIQMKPVKAKMLEPGVGYIRVSDFSEMMDLFDKEVKNLQTQGLKALILDLRFNGGGLLDESVKLADRFLDEGVIVTTRGRTSDDDDVRRAQKGDTLPPWPLAVLVNEASASASEVFAGAMKDHRRGVLVGARTFGKGLVQRTFELPEEARLKITTARYYTPDGTCVQREDGKKDYGLDPDYRVEMSPEEYSQLMKKWNDDRIIKRDPPAEPSPFVDLQLNAALEVIHAKLEGREPKVEPRILGKSTPSEK